MPEERPLLPRRALDNFPHFLTAGGEDSGAARMQRVKDPHEPKMGPWAVEDLPDG